VRTDRPARSQDGTDTRNDEHDRLFTPRDKNHGRFGMMTLRSIAAAVLMTMVGTAAGAAVYEIDADGAVARVDAPPLPELQQRVLRARQPAAAAPRSAAFRPLVVSAAARYDISPALIDAIAHTESRYNQQAVSRSNALGIMQLMPATARELGVDRRDAADNIRGGTAYLRYLLNRFDGDMICAIAAYNAGPGAVSKARCVPPYRETRSYVAAVLDRLARADDGI
jgi:soluble lytic murein transglycosylase-like protein